MSQSVYGNNKQINNKLNTHPVHNISFGVYLTFYAMLDIVLGLLLVVPQCIGQQHLQTGKTSDIPTITCPEISCHLHQFPQEHCKVQTFFIYHGVRCKGCVEDICYGSQAVADSLIAKDVSADAFRHLGMSLAHVPFDSQHIPGETNRFLRIRARLLNKLIPDNLRTTSYIFGPDHESFGQPNFQFTDGVNGQNQATCPKIECDKHHTPAEHCIVETYFLYQDKRCIGCTEDICLGAQTVAESLIGKNDSSIQQEGQLNTNGQIPLRQTIDVNRFGNPLFRSQNSDSMMRNSLWRQNRNQNSGIPSFGSQTIGDNSEINRNPSLETTQIPRSRSNTRQSNDQTNTGAITVIEQQPTSPNLNNGRGIKRFTGSARTYLQSLFHPAFTG